MGWAIFPFLNYFYNPNGGGSGVKCPTMAPVGMCSMSPTTKILPPWPTTVSPISISTTAYLPTSLSSASPLIKGMREWIVGRGGYNVLQPSRVEHLSGISMLARCGPPARSGQSACQHRDLLVDAETSGGPMLTSVLIIVRSKSGTGRVYRAKKQ